MAEFRITFGMREPDSEEPHPMFPAAHHNGYVTIIAPDEMAARDIAYAHLGSRWAFIYSQPLDGWAPTKHGGGHFTETGEHGIYTELARWDADSDPTEHFPPAPEWEVVWRIDSPEFRTAAEAAAWARSVQLDPNAQVGHFTVRPRSPQQDVCTSLASDEWKEIEVHD